MRLLITLLLAIGGFSAATAAPLNSKTLQKLTCEGVTSKFSTRGAKPTDCLKGSFKIVDTESTKIHGKKVTTLMVIESAFSDMTFKVDLKRLMSVDDSGKLIATGWELGEVVAVSFGDTNIVINSNKSSKNVRESGYVEDYPQEVLDWSEYGNNDDYVLDSLEMYEVYKTEKQKKLIGYIVTEFVSSEELDIKIKSTAKFDKKGKMVDYDEESWGYHE